MSDEARDAVTTVSVIIPTYQRRALVLAAVRSLQGQQPAPPYEIIVVVDGSTDGTATALGELDPAVRVIEQPNAGAAAARNAGAAAASGSILLFMDDDMEAEPDMVRQHVLAHRDGTDAVLGHIPLHPESPPTVLTEGVKAWADARRDRLSAPDAKLELHDLLTGQLSVKADIFAAIQGFDRQFTRDGDFGNEDLDLGLRLLRDGYAIRFVPQAVSWQCYSVTPEQHLRQWRSAGRADVCFARKHPEEGAALFNAANVRSIVTSLVFRPLARTCPQTRLWAGLRGVTIKLADRPGRLARKLFFGMRALEYWAGVEEAGGPPTATKATILAYHAMSDLSSSPLLSEYGVPAARFAEQLAALERDGRQLVSPAEVAAFLTGKAKLPRKAVMLTFDDAYEDIVPAMDLITTRGGSGVVFAVSSQLGGYNRWDAALGAPRLSLMSAKALGSIETTGLEIGAHSRTHPMLDRLTRAELEEEINGSLDDLEAAGVQRPRFFAYPYGASNRLVRQVALASGALAAFSVTPGVMTRQSDPFNVPRIEVLRSDTGARLLWKIRLARPAGWLAVFWRAIPERIRSRIEKLARLTAGKGAGS